MKWLVDSRNPEVPRGLVEKPAKDDTNVYPLGTLFTREGDAVIPHVLCVYKGYNILKYEVN